MPAQGPDQSRRKKRGRAAQLMKATAAWALVLGSAQAAPPVVHPGLWPAAQSPPLVTAQVEAQITALISRMSLEEKVGQMIQADISTIRPEDLRDYPLGAVLAGGNSGPGGNDRAAPQQWLELVRAFQAVAAERRPGHTPIPILFGIDAVHGNNNLPGATIFPHNIALGAAHDPALIRRIGAATAEEIAVAGADWTFAPTLATPRDDRWGRTFEGYSEDPEIVRAYAGAMVEGLQGAPGSSQLIQHGQVSGSAKHFLGDGGTLGGRDQGDNPASEQELIAVHAQGYPVAVDAGVDTVMASFSSWRGEKMHGARALLTDVLKGRMGFAGFVVGDWNGHGQVPGCSNESCPTAVKAGLDMFMAPDSWKGLYRNTLAQARSGEIPMARIDDAVRRILRVKFREGLFERDRPYEGRFERLAAPDHRAIAREAVRESLVLLKNDGVLPIKGSAHVLVAGDGADDIGKQAGGWTISWQGTGNKNADFPHGQSIYDGVREAVAAQGGSAELAPDGAFKTRPDVAVVVFGENPYAEFQGDIPTLEYQPGGKTDLALLRRLKAQGVPVVAVFLSGRPLWVNPEINAADAFVAAWLPGTEGGGVADVLVGDRAGKPRADFHGKLSYSWPRRADQTRLNRGQPRYHPLFAYGYGLTYADHARLPVLSEDPGVAAATADPNLFFAAGRTRPPWRFVLSGGGKSVAEPPGGPAAVDDLIRLQPADAEGVQERGRAVAWTGGGTASFAVAGEPADLTRQANGDMAVAIRLRVDRAPAASVRMAACSQGQACPAGVDVTSLLAADGGWRTIKVKLSCLARGADLSRVAAPVTLTTAGALALTVSDVRLVSNEGDALCPGAT